MQKYIMYPHSGSGNHGCEAIVRTTNKILKDKKTILFSENKMEDETYLGTNFMDIRCSRKAVSRRTLKYIKAFWNVHIRKQRDAFDAMQFAPVISECDKDTVLMSIGGDNYCYGDNEFIYLVNRYARKQGSKTILWGCSVEAGEISDRMRVDLEAYDLIVARESLTYDALKRINKNTVLYPDPAFTLQQEKGIFPEGLGKKPYIGINISPMIQGKEKITGITIKNYEVLIQGILETSDNDIALIPHVIWSHNDDRQPLRELYNKFSKSGRVYLVEDQNCMQLKNIISECRIFIGARTHATIAAYSTCVPTLVVGYSVKARGIAKDLFGRENNYVIPVQKLQNEDDLLSAYKWIAERENQIRKHLTEIMPEYIKKAQSAGTVIGEKL